MKPVRYLDRETGRIETERVFGERELRLFYEHPVGRRLTGWVFSRGPFNRLYGWLQRRPGSRGKVAGFCERLGVDVAAAEAPPETYASLDAFFARRLRPGARPIDPEPDHLLAPADGRTLVVPELAAGGELSIKGSQVSVAELLGDAARAGRYAGGAAVVVRLAPVDYHRFHFPAEGWAGRSRRLGGPLHSVHPIALGAGAPSFLNKREVTRLGTGRFGLITQVEVGAMVVGTIEQTYRPGPVRRGQEKGTFRMGGSTVVLLLEPGRVTLDADLLEASAAGLEVLVRVGTRIGIAHPPVRQVR